MTPPNPQDGGKHTPGPWRISDEIYIRDASVSGAYIAEIDPLTDFEGNDEEKRANLLLIVAAPAMYAALCAVRDLGLYSHGQSPVMEQVVAALLQATGGENGR